MNWQFIVTGLFVLLVLVYIYPRLAHPFWSKQPVYHWWDVSLWSVSGRIIRDEAPLINCYVDVVRGKTVPVLSIPNETKKAVTTLIGRNYLRSESVNYEPTEDAIFDYLSSKSALVTTWNDNRGLHGVLTSRPLEANLPSVGNCIVGYVDNLTVKKGSRKKGIAPRLIQTYLHQAHELNPNWKVHFFKREGSTNPTVPLTTYNTYYYYGYQLNSPSTNISMAADKDLNDVFQALWEDFSKHDLNVCLGQSELLKLVNCQRVYVLKSTRADGMVEGALLVRNVPSYDKERRSLLEVMYFLPMNPSASEPVIYSSLLTGLGLIHDNFVFSVERVGRLAGDCCSLTIKPYSQCTMSYFFYNYACQTMDANKCAILV